MENLLSINSNVSTYGTTTSNKTENGTLIVSKGEETSKDLFLKMLVAQMTNQDPFNPQDPTEYVTQLAQFNTLEQMMSLNDNMEYLLSTNNGILANSAVETASTLIGKTVSVYAPQEDAGSEYGELTYSGKVEGVSIKDGVVYMDIRIDETGELKSIEYGALVKINSENNSSIEESKGE